MTFTKSLIAAGLVLAASTAVNADPIIKLLPSGAKSGGNTVLSCYADPNGSVLTACIMVLKVDTTKVTVTAGGVVNQWEAPSLTVIDANTVRLSTTCITQTYPGQSTPGLVFSLNIQKKDDSVVPVTVDTADPSTGMADDQFNTFPFPAGLATTILPGATRNLGGAISGSPSVGLNSIAVVAGNSLRLLKKDDLSDLNGAGAALGAGITGRPSFGAIGGQAVVAVGTTDGKVSVFDASTGAAVGSAVTVGTSASSPAITADGTIYVAASNGTNASLVKVSGATTSPVTIPGNAIKSDIAVFGGYAVVATDAGVQTIRTADMVPQASVADAAIASSPVLNGAGGGVIASASKLYGINTTTGAVDAGIAAPGLASEGFLAADGIYYGGADGSVQKYAAGALTSIPTLTGAIAAQPLVIGGKVYAADAKGSVKAGAKDAVALGGATTKALAATGTTAADSLVVAMPEGVIAELPL